ncbi:hypothetical protein MVEG_08128 [Podila verticillata NRRL 6337]|nr:hypothetical protein MVEG_08128 [Podila verticillata NRRL 6337]
MNSMPQHSVMEYYDQFRRFIAFLEANFTFIPGVAESRNMTTLETKLWTIHGAIQADSQRHQHARAENDWLYVENEKLRNECYKSEYEKNWIRSENERLFSINAGLVDSNKQIHAAKVQFHADNDQLKMELKMLRTRLPPDPPTRPTDKENAQPRSQSENTNSGHSMEAQLEAAHQSRALDHDYVAIIKKDNESLTTRLRTSEHRVSDLNEELERTKARLIEKLLGEKRSDSAGLSRMWAWYQEDIEKVQAIVAEKQKDINALLTDLAQCKLSLRKAQVKIGQKNRDLDRMAGRLEIMAQDDRKQESETSESGKRQRGHSHQKESREPCSDRCQWNKEKVKSLEDKVQELRGRLDNMANAVEENEKSIKKMRNNEEQLVQDATRAKSQLQQSIAIAKKLDQERLRQTEALRETLAHAKMATTEFKKRTEEYKLKIKELEARLKDKGSKDGDQALEQQSQGSEKYLSCERVLDMPMELVAPRRDSVVSGTSTGDAK